MSSIVESLKAFFEQCPLLKNGKINVNYLGLAPSYSLEIESANPVLKRYVDGSELRRLAFVFASREFYDENDLHNMNVARFYEELGNWIEEQNKNRNLPDLSDLSLSAQEILLTSVGYICSSKNASARFQLRGELTYKKEG